MKLQPAKWRPKVKLQCGILDPPMATMGQLHALPHRNIAVCFTPVSGIDSCSQGLPGRAISGILRCDKSARCCALVSTKLSAA
jgi:hypothetical protein